MFERTPEVKVLRDPVHGYIHVDLRVIWDVINSSWFQRLRRIRQLGGAYMVYHCAEHTRFSHSLGVYEIVRRMVTEVEDIREALSEREKVTVMLAALLHDCGHGPYSHALESVTGVSHEVFTCRIIEEDTEITRILERCAPGLAKETADVIRHTCKNPLMTQLISSQLDADRMDYLLRDAYFTGTKYGVFDLERILRTLRVDAEKGLIIKKSGVFAVEYYIMARYHMYWQVYYHPVARSYEGIIHLLFRRLKETNTEQPLLKGIMDGGNMDLDTFFRMDEYTCSCAFDMLADSDDGILRDLALRIRDRKLFKYTDSDPATDERIRTQLAEAGYDLKYYWFRDTVAQNPYTPYTVRKDNAIWVRMEDGTVREISEASNIVYSLIHGPANDDHKIFFPEISG